MLSWLLPGLRDLRNPFVAGSLLFGAAFVVFHNDFESATTRKQLGPGLHALSDRVGDHGKLAVLAVAAYVVGALVVGAIDHVTRRIARRLLRSGYQGAQYATGQHRNKRQRILDLVAPLTRTAVSRLGRYGRDDGAFSALQVVAIGVDIVSDRGMRLLVESKDLYLEVDRMSAEATFRDAVVAGGTAFVGAALLTSNWGFRTELVVVAVFLPVPHCCSRIHDASNATPGPPTHTRSQTARSRQRLSTA